VATARNRRGNLRLEFQNRMLFRILKLTTTLRITWIMIVIACLFVGSFFLILLDICAGLPFLMAVKPSERTEMSAIYSSFRDVSGILTPGVAWLVLLVAPLSGIFAAAGSFCAVAWLISGRLHPRLGQSRMKPLPPLGGKVMTD
ncbi:MAG: hypothetical protein NWR52_05935, partial [Paracoccaceae bacterium]|nr:hypothetical protein [Paracoccaceae bacterium]